MLCFLLIVSYRRHFFTFFSKNSAMKDRFFLQVPGLLRKQNYGERFDRLMDRATGIFNTLLARAAKTPRNYILDQTNVYKSARKRKLKEFVNYKKVQFETLQCYLISLNLHLS